MESINIKTNTRTEFIDATGKIAAAAKRMGVDNGLLTLFVPHTTAGVTINENSDPDVLSDMCAVLDRLVPWNANYRHGEGNSAAHVKASLMGAEAQIIVGHGRLLLGTWQSIYFCEFDGPRSRQLWVKASV